MTYPVSKQGNTIDDYHGTPVRAPYRWLEDLKGKGTRTWIDAQNTLASSHLDSLPGRPYFYERLTHLNTSITPTRVRRQGRRWVTRRQSLDGDYVFLVRDTIDTPPRILLDPSLLGSPKDTVVRDVSISPNGELFAYTIVGGGVSAGEIRFHDVAGGCDLPDRIAGTKWGLPQWTANSKAVIYNRLLRPGINELDGIDRESVVGYHVLGTSLEQDQILYRVNPDEIGAGAVSTLVAPGRFLFINDHYDHKDSAVLIDLGDPMAPNPNGPRITLTEGRDGSNSLVGIHESTVYLLTTVDAPKGRIVAFNMDRPSRFRTIVPESDNLLERARLVGGRLCVGFRKHVCSELIVFDLNGHRLHDVRLPTLGSAFWFSGDADHPLLTFAFDSYTYPLTSFAHNVTTQETIVLNGGMSAMNTENYSTQQVFYSSKDGTRVPMFIISRADADAPGPRPTMLYGYGAVGAVEDPIFNLDWFAWIEAGGILAVANIRGGGEYGEAWHRAGMLGNKQNTFDDFVAAAEHLIRQQHTTPEQLVIHGKSNGGMLVGAVMTQRPDLFAAAMPAAGVLDALRFPSFTAGPRWAKDMGDPCVRPEFEWLYAWSPLHRIRDGTCYPATLVTTALNDDIVHPSQSYKFVARMQTAQSCRHAILLRAYETGGHKGSIGWETRARELADRLAFAAHHTGLSVPIR
jgi:prolyl oligopeptidase